MKKLCKAAAAFLLCAGVLTGCGSKEDTKTEKKIPVVSVAQIVEHKSLNTIRDSFKAEMEALGYEVRRLHRSRLAFLHCSDLRQGEYRVLKPFEVKQLRSLAQKGEMKQR